MLKEQRRYPRIPVNKEVCLKLLNGRDKGDENSGETSDTLVTKVPLINISPSGMQLGGDRNLVEYLSERKSSAGLFPVINIEFQLPATRSSGESFKKSNGKGQNENTPKMVAAGQIVYCRRLSQNDYQLGLEFTEISEEDRERVIGFVRSHSPVPS